MATENKLIPIPFARDASSAYTNEIPANVTETDTGLASYTTGFPPRTFIPKVAGGLPVRGADFNGVLNDITVAIKYMQGGNFQVYNSDYATAIGGYSDGAVIQGSDGNLYRSDMDSNLDDPINSNNWSLFANTENLNYLPAVKSGDTYTVSTKTEYKITPTVNGANVLTESESMGRLGNVIKFEASGTYTPSTGVKFIIVEAVGGGGAGGGAQSSSTAAVSIGSGGGGGAYCKSKLLKSEIGSSVSIIIGAGGSGVSGAIGGNGGNTTFGNFITAGGGGGGVKSGPSEGQFITSTSSGGSATGGNIMNLTGEGSGFGFTLSSTVRRSGDGGGSILSYELGTGTSINKEGYSASGFGCGGGGACMYGAASSYKGGDGYKGLVIVWEYM